jgi:ankyrin repeat protein
VSFLTQVKIEACHSTFLLPVDDVAVEFKLDSVTHYGDTVLHLLLAKSHNKLAFKVFESNKCLMKACNRNLETPLHYAAKVGNEEAIHELIKLDSGVIKDALRQANCKGDTALHEAAIHDHGGICCELMKLDRHMACQANKQGLSALYIAIIEGHNSVVESMLQVDSTLVCTQFSDGMYPVLVAAKMGNQKLLFQFLEKHPKCAEFLDPRGRNIYHMAAEQEDEKLITELYNSDVHKGLINAMDYKGNTPLHVAAMEGHKGVMFALWKKMSDDCNNAPNKKGQTPFDLSVIQMKNSSDKKV